MKLVSLRKVDFEKIHSEFPTLSCIHLILTYIVFTFIVYHILVSSEQMLITCWLIFAHGADPEITQGFRRRD